MNDIVWQSKLDGVYDVIVRRTSEYSGLLTVRDEHRLILEKPVSLAYGAVFGPGIEDVEAWGQIACASVDELKQYGSNKE